ncbi:hypothetical protein DDD_1731 [Nonlabens dokdonensis DSW-6]|uniref:Uncharacterized protein n=1 Tax=Nonlabens dokdonensis (strain DSM 17205 / KCTC 12402 / DSW-6) TaxID=592029 RepID=L7WDA4_NONDD|nr:hypothetical protein DDD_1731 [Nonlabens dokdonensis DSW-6]
MLLWLVLSGKLLFTSTFCIIYNISFYFPSPKPKGYGNTDI